MIKTYFAASIIYEIPPVLVLHPFKNLFYGLQDSSLQPISGFLQLAHLRMGAYLAKLSQPGAQ